MALGRCEAIYEETGKPVCITDRYNIPRKHDLWVGNPAWDKNSDIRIIDGAGARSYIERWHGARSIFNFKHRARAGKVYLTKEELEFNKLEGDYIIIAPNLKLTASPNKQWGFAKFQELVNQTNYRFIQLYQDGERLLSGVEHIKTPSARLALSIIKGAKLVIANEGGSHHMAASMDVPAVVFFGSFTSPEVTGYKEHINFTVKNAHYCGNWEVCLECQKSMAKITVDVVLSYFNKFMKGEDVSGIHRI
jgi:hypothetical protein